MLHKTDGLVPLQQISIRGGLFSRVQDRNYWQFDRYVRIFKPDAAAEQRAFERFVKHPYPDGVRLDSIVDGREKISYYYTQEVPTKGEGKTMPRHTCGSGRRAGRQPLRYAAPRYAGIQYYLDADLRRHHEALPDQSGREVCLSSKTATTLPSEVGKSDIIDTLETNACSALPAFEALMDGLINQREFYVDSIRADRFWHHRKEHSRSTSVWPAGVPCRSNGVWERVSGGRSIR